VTEQSPSIEVSAEAGALLEAALAQSGAAEYIRVRVGRG
jgi:hypothetical protein